jgi:hypothetical protein
MRERAVGMELGLEFQLGPEEDIPSTIDKPERRMGTREIVSGVMVVVVYSKPRCVLLLRGVSILSPGIRQRRNHEG